MRVQLAWPGRWECRDCLGLRVLPALRDQQDQRELPALLGQRDQQEPMVLEVRLAVSAHKARWGFLDCRVLWVRKGLQVPMALRALLGKQVKLEQQVLRVLQDRLVL